MTNTSHISTKQQWKAFENALYACLHLLVGRQYITPHTSLEHCTCIQEKTFDNSPQKSWEWGWRQSLSQRHSLSVHETGNPASLQLLSLAVLLRKGACETPFSILIQLARTPWSLRLSNTNLNSELGCMKSLPLLQLHHRAVLMPVTQC